MPKPYAPKEMMRGIRRYYNQFRAYVVDKEGVHHQEYFREYDLAVAFILKHRPAAIGNAKYKKREGAKQDVPVGLCDTTRRRKLINGGFSIATIIVATVVINGKAKSFARQYGNKRTRAQAIKLCSDWRNKMLKKTKLKRVKIKK